ncbi:hypothetical protein T439DRAFT_376909 [Meredithblackwellia eburnea MCA 4105]
MEEEEDSSSSLKAPTKYVSKRTAEAVRRNLEYSTSDDEPERKDRPSAKHAQPHPDTSSVSMEVALPQDSVEALALRDQPPLQPPASIFRLVHTRKPIQTVYRFNHEGKTYYVHVKRKSSKKGGYKFKVTPAGSLRNDGYLEFEEQQFDRQTDNPPLFDYHEGLALNPKEKGSYYWRNDKDELVRTDVSPKLDAQGKPVYHGPLIVYKKKSEVVGPKEDNSKESKMSSIGRSYHRHHFQSQSQSQQYQGRGVQVFKPRASPTASRSRDYDRHEDSDSDDGYEGHGRSFEYGRSYRY